MSNTWPTLYQDLIIAEQVLSRFIEPEITGLNLFELVVNVREKTMDFTLSPWVVALAEKYASMYGEDEGELITRRVISLYMRERHTLH